MPGSTRLVQVERGADLCMPEAFAGDFRMDARREHLRGVGVPQIVKPDVPQARSLQEHREGMSDAVRLERRPVCLQPIGRRCHPGARWRAPSNKTPKCESAVISQD